MLDEDLKRIKSELKDHMDIVEVMQEKYPDKFKGRNNQSHSNLKYHLCLAFNKVNEILNNYTQG